MNLDELKNILLSTNKFKQYMAGNKCSKIMIYNDNIIITIHIDNPIDNVVITTITFPHNIVAIYKLINGNIYIEDQPISHDLQMRKYYEKKINELFASVYNGINVINDEFKFYNKLISNL